MQTDILMLIVIVAMILPIFFIKNTRTSHNRLMFRGRNETDANLENLYRIQNYEFWRDFGKRGNK